MAEATLYLMTTQTTEEMNKMEYKVQVIIKPLDVIANPEGKAIERALSALSFTQANKVRVGKVVNFSISADTAEAAQKITEEICQKLLVNPVMEYSEILISQEAG
ncbi:MAG: phosphoribosylformylglycinamidine synthase subunit PurS [Firmicutes bacterium]|jgi:phosphoribosylformylglycinamidine synthase|nr:phosphoribosylformylglycinamidine synthase subunit PurS [Bacillota bacterium]